MLAHVEIVNTNEWLIVLSVFVQSLLGVNSIYLVHLVNFIGVDKRLFV